MAGRRSQARVTRAPSWGRMARRNLCPGPDRTARAPRAPDEGEAQRPRPFRPAPRLSSLPRIATARAAPGDASSRSAPAAGNRAGRRDRSRDERPGRDRSRRDRSRRDWPRGEEHNETQPCVPARSARARPGVRPVPTPASPGRIGGKPPPGPGAPLCHMVFAGPPREPESQACPDHGRARHPDARASTNLPLSPAALADRPSGMSCTQAMRCRKDAGQRPSFPAVSPAPDPSGAPRCAPPPVARAVQSRPPSAGPPALGSTLPEPKGTGQRASSNPEALPARRERHCGRARRAPHHARQDRRPKHLTWCRLSSARAWRPALRSWQPVSTG
ncbi:hypothetical protein SAMN05878426_101274 [Phaeovulum vinaykumarii]|uniref:Uncharacterized protein n=1 Tax=Phaeovulum vinaykumarii TaxID=407234 RepID=A0A1N7JRL9_9RHOB|nr:hypothetical protein SAMN05421795_101274 [Phaeovulum vinaykumarii]SOB91039.1 hypothetical protein SAMN05878426_101274 [Phaeovulum vinaykumarii]